MSYINDREFATLSHLWQEIRDNEGYVPEKTFFEFSETMQGFVKSRKIHREKTTERVRKCREKDKSYGHDVKKPLFQNAYVYFNGGTKKNAGAVYKMLRAESPDKIDSVIEEYKKKTEN